jgi:hypothetical protein
VPTGEVHGSSYHRRILSLSLVVLVLVTDGATVAELPHDLDRRHPGIRFRLLDEQDRIQPHMRIFVNRALEPDLERTVAPDDEVVITQALSDG